jgi:hypothetical protein
MVMLLNPIGIGSKPNPRVSRRPRAADAGAYRSELRAQMNDAGRAITYGLIDPPLGGPGPSVSFRRDSKGQSEMVLTVDGEVPDAKDGGGPPAPSTSSDDCGAILGSAWPHSVEAGAR